MKSIFVLTALVASTLAAPTLTWSPELGQFYAAVNNHIKSARTARDVTPPSCNIATLTLPTAPTPLPSPSGLTLSHIALGRGIQNYTCSLASPQVTPVSIGAVANLYNVSCIAANYPDIFEMLPDLSVQYPLPANPDGDLEPSNIKRTGHHYFNAAGVPTFDLRDDPTNNLGVTYAKVANRSAVPVTAIRGAGGVGDGSVAWLALTATNATTNDIKMVYRVNTAGGAPPSDCSSSPAVFSVQYAAEYWFYS